jgi:probable HAF family extracellular repeat protein
LLIALTVSPASGQATYTITDIGTFAGGGYSYAAAINNSGQVTGFSDSAAAGSFHFHGFLYSSGTLLDLGTLPGYSVSFGYGINDAAQVTGESRADANSSAGIGFRYSAGTMTSLGTLPGDTYSAGYSINNLGQITGFSSPAAGICCFHAVLFTGGVVSDIGTLPGGTFSGGLAINNHGQITGASDGAAFKGQHAFLCGNGNMIDLGAAAGEVNPDYYGTAINDAGQIAVDSTINGAPSKSHAYLYTGGQFVPLGNLPGGTSSYGAGVGSAGQIVGIADGSGFRSHGFLYSNGQMTDVNTLIPANSGWTLLTAVAMNNAGQIVGQGTIGAAIHAYVITPPTISGLTALTQSFNLPFGTENSLLAKLQAASAAGPGNAACSDLNDFIAQVQAQSGKKITVAEANQLIATATQAEVAQGCS